MGNIVTSFQTVKLLVMNANLEVSYAPPSGLILAGIVFFVLVVRDSLLYSWHVHNSHRSTSGR